MCEMVGDYPVDCSGNPVDLTVVNCTVIISYVERRVLWNLQLNTARTFTR